MTDHKVGDRVQLKATNMHYGSQNYGGPGEVVRDTVDGYLIVAFDNSGSVGGFRPGEIEPEQKPMRTRAEVEAELARLVELSSDKIAFMANRQSALRWVLNND